MNLSKIVCVLKKQFGLYVVALPFKDEVTGQPTPPEIIIQDIIKTVTIPMYSQYQPWIREGDADLAKLKIIDKRRFIYELPDYLTITPVKYIIDIRLPFMNTRGTFGDISPTYGINRSVSGVISSMAYMNLAGQMRAEPTFEYLGNNHVRMYG